MTSDRIPQEWEVWHARFKYSEGKGYKYRPVIVVGVRNDASLVMMITSATNNLSLEHDYLIKNWREAGLDKPSITRADHIAQIPAGYLGSAGYSGRLAQADIDALTLILADVAFD